MKPATLLLLTGLLVGQGSTARAQRQVEVQVYDEAPLPFATDNGIRLSSAARNHGLLRIRWWESEWIPGPGSAELDYNTDTLFLAYHHNGFFGPRTHLSAFAKGQIRGANLLFDHVVAGRLDPEQEFLAHYLQAGAVPSLLVASDAQGQIWFDGLLAARQWFFSPRQGTAPDLVLPPAMQVIESGLRARFFRGQKKTTFARPHGFTGQAGFESHFRFGARDWGALGANDTGRNRVTSHVPWLMQAQLQAGLVGKRLWGVTPTFRVRGDAGQGFGLDDLNRFLVGGENPWVIPLAGAAWAEFHADQFVGTSTRVGGVIFEHLALDFGLDAVALNDPLRQGLPGQVGIFTGSIVSFQARLPWRLILSGHLGNAHNLPRPRGEPAWKAGLGLAWQAL
jgi:hypothetical protein